MVLLLIVFFDVLRGRLLRLRWRWLLLTGRILGEILAALGSLLLHHHRLWGLLLHLPIVGVLRLEGVVQVVHLVVRDELLLLIVIHVLTWSELLLGRLLLLRHKLLRILLGVQIECGLAE